MHEGQSLTAWELIVIAIVGTHGFSIRYTVDSSVTDRKKKHGLLQVQLLYVLL